MWNTYIAFEYDRVIGTPREKRMYDANELGDEFPYLLNIRSF
jgi:hypothetical protein